MSEHRSFSSLVSRRSRCLSFVTQHDYSALHGHNAGLFPSATNLILTGSSAFCRLLMMRTVSTRRSVSRRSSQPAMVRPWRHPAKMTMLWFSDEDIDGVRKDETPPPRSGHDKRHRTTTVSCSTSDACD